MDGDSRANESASEPPSRFDFERFAQRSRELLCVARASGRLLWVNDAWETTLGWSKETLLSRPFFDFVHPDDLRATSKEAERIDRMSAEQKVDSHFTNRYKHKEGGWRWLEWSTQIGSDGLLYCHVRDVSVRMKRQRELERRNRFLELSEELADIGHWRIDLEEGTVEWSPQVYRIHGLDPESHTPTLESGIEAYHPDDRERVATLVNAAIERLEPFEFELRLIRADGVTRLVHCRGLVEPDAFGTRARGVFGVFQDVTEREQMRARLIHAEKLASIGTLAAGVGHEVNTPLSFIKTNSQLLHEELEGLAGVSPSGRLSELREMAAEILDGVTRIQRIVQGLRTFARAGEPRCERLELPRVLDVAARLSATEVRHRARLVRDFDPATPHVMGDETQVVQVAVNLLVNAAHATPESMEDAQIVLSCGRSSDGSAYFSVKDDGVGIPPELASRVFEPFFTTKGPGTGTGLGLAISHGIVEALGGRIVIDSGGSGTEMRVLLPAAPSMSSAPPRRQARVASRVLVIDDEPLVGRALQRTLRESRVAVETNSRAALERLESGECFDVVICDLMMPGLNGDELYERAIARVPTLEGRFVFITGGALSLRAQEFLDSVPELALEKPIDIDAVRRAVRNISSSGPTLRLVRSNDPDR